MDSQQQLILDLYNKGMSKKAIAQSTGISTSTISKYLPGPITDIGERIIELRNQGSSIRQIAQKLQCSKTTVSKWCDRISNNQDIIDQHNKQRTKQHEQNKVRRRQNNLSQQSGSNDNYRNWRQKARHDRKKFLLDLAGGKCTICNYHRCNDALVFHHKDPKTKLFDIRGVRLEFDIDRLLKEVGKCILLCHNCHSEVHNGMTSADHIQLININVPIPEHIRNFKKIDITDDIKDNEIKWIKKKKQARQLLPRKSIEIDLKLVSIMKGKKAEVDDILNKYHYLGATSKGAIYNLIFKYNDMVIGASVISNPVRQTSFESTCEISRFVLTVDCHNLATKCLSLIIKHIRSHGKYKRIQAFSDDSLHTGTIYKACNFRQVGGKYNTYNYDGIHKKTIYHRAMALGLNEHQYAEMFNLNRIIESPKTKFMLTLE